MRGATKLTVKTRQDRGTKRARRLREQGLIPGIIYGHKEEPVRCAVNQAELAQALHHGARLVETGLPGSSGTDRKSVV
mgnify:FL=1